MGPNKKKYTKPELRIIELKAEEVMVSGCKTNLISKPLGPTCMFKRCSGPGS